MTKGFFRESVTKEIVLPEDDPDSFGRMIEHLYDNNEGAFSNLLDVDDGAEKVVDDGAEELVDDGAEKLADMYGLAGKYQLPDFQYYIVQKLGQLDVLRRDKMKFFRLARQIWENTRESDDIFERYFERQSTTHLKSMSEEEVEELFEMASSEKSFAKKLLQVQAGMYSELQWIFVTNGAKLKKEIQLLRTQLSHATTGAEVDVENGRENHRTNHSSCRLCFYLR